MKTYTIKLLLGGNENIHTTAITLKDGASFKEVETQAYDQMLSEEDQTVIKEIYGSDNPTIEQMKTAYEDLDYTLIVEL